MSDETPKPVDLRTKSTVEQEGEGARPRQAGARQSPDPNATIASVRMGRYLVRLTHGGSRDTIRRGRIERGSPRGRAAGLLAGVVASQQQISANNEKMLANSEKILVKEVKTRSE